jgi:L-aspartate oxidase
MNAGPARIRCLPRSRPSFERDADVVVVGSGAAGLSAALAAARRGAAVLLVTKDDLGAGCTPLAQGGLAAAIGPGDSAALHERDTIQAGAGLCDPVAVAAVVAAAPAEVRRLTGMGARLDSAALHLEGGHSRSRIVNAGGDAFGAEVYRVLRAAVLASPVEVLTRTVALDVLISGPDSGGGPGPATFPAAGHAGAGGAATARVGGLLVGVSDGSGMLRQGMVAAPAVILATGGFGQAFATTTNPAGLTGDGLALAARAGAELQDVEFVQFHPTVLWQQAGSGRRLLITEALRGAGAVLVDPAGRPVMAGQHPLGDLAPRDVVSAAMQLRMERGDGPGDHLWLDATRVGRAVLERHFPTVTAGCRALGIDPASEPIPVAPGAHYACGGIRANMDGRTSVPGLYAVGEAASTGVHGANRLASNSLTEALIAGRRAGDLLGQSLSEPLPLRGRSPAELPGPAAGLHLPPAGTAVDPAARPALAAAMSRHAGVLRDRDGLECLLTLLDAARPAAACDGLDLATVEATNLHTVSVLVAVAALARAESRGCHRWRGMPAVSAEPASHSILQLDDGELVAAGTQEAARALAAGVPATCAGCAG